MKLLAAALALSTLIIVPGGFADAAVRNYFAPEVNGARLDSCLSGERDCGKPAADAFCKKEGYDSAVLFQREAAARTLRLGSGDLCSGASCKSFKQIKCYTPKGDLASVTPQ